MTKQPSPADVPGDLRVRAEKFLAAGGPGLKQLPPDEVLQLVHELQVHQIELEMQNEELRRAQETIIETGNRYADLYDFAPVGYVTLDPQGLIVEINLTAARLLGAPRDTLLQKPFILSVAPGDRRAFYAYLQGLQVGAPPQSSELEINPRQGPPSAISLESLAIVEAGGKIIQYRMAITDITRRRQAEDGLRRSEEKFRLLYEKAPLGYQSLDEDGIIREVNQAWLNLMGYTRQEVIGRWFGDFLPPDSFELFPERVACLKGAGEVCNLDFEMARKDGSRITVSFYWRVAVDDTGGFVQTHCMFQDITARKQAEEALRATEERLRLKLDSILSPDTAILDEDLSNILDAPAIQSLMEDFTRLTSMAMAILDLQGKVLVATGWQDICTQYHRVHPQAAENCTASDLFLAQNLRPGEYVAYKCQNHLWDVATPLFIGGKHVGNVFCGQFFYDDEVIDEQLFIDQGAKYGFDQDLYLAALHRVPRISRARVKPLMDFLTKFSVLVSKLSYSNLKLAKAISEQQRNEAEIIRQSGQLRALAARLAEAEEKERQHLARELHDQVCQSLTALSLTLTLLQTQMPRKAAAKLRGRLDGAVALVEQIAETIRDVMAELRPPMLDDYGLLSALHWYGAEFSDKTGISVEVTGQEVVPRLAAPVELALFRIVQEAMANIAKHARATAVVLTEAEDNGTVRLGITDNGVGFDQERLGQPEGRHLYGLMTMSERAAAVGGRCRIESQPGQGTRVLVEVSR